MCSSDLSTFSHVFANNVYINNLHVGGLTKEEAKQQLLAQTQEELEQHSLVLYKNDIQVEAAYSNLDVTYNIDETIDEAFEIGHTESLFKQYNISKNGVEDQQNFILEQIYNDSAFESFIHEHAEIFYIAQVNATMDRVNRTFVITPEQVGAEVDEKATLISVKEAILTSTELVTKVEVVQRDVEALYKSDLFTNAQTLISSFSTPFNNASANRNENLKVAAQKISRLLLPDEIFYLSNQLEPFTEAAGYKNAGVIVNGKIEDGLGGGVCQVASTLYNAVLLTDIEIVKRQNHSLPVSYVPLGRDATYATGVIDFQFKNNTGYPVYIEGFCENNNVYINIYGHNSAILPYEVKFESQLIEVIPAPDTIYEDDDTLEEGKEVIEVQALDGKRIKLYKLYYLNGTLEKKELVNTSYYKPRAAVIRRGTKQVVPEPPVEEAPSFPDQPNIEVPVTPDVSTNNATTSDDIENTFEIPQT